MSNVVQKYEVDLIDSMGSDLRVVDSARVSFNKTSEWENIPEEILYGSDKNLIRYLSIKYHFTPFTHCVITLRETIPIFVARQRFKHTIGFSYNEVSRRYVDDPPSFYSPPEWRKRAKNKKQGSSDEIISDMELFPDIGMNHSERNSSDAYQPADDFYKYLLSKDVAPEQARMVLPQSMMTSYYVTGSLYAFARAYNLRTKDNAQKEITFLANAWDSILSNIFPVSWHYLKNADRIKELAIAKKYFEQYHIPVPGGIIDEYDTLYEMKIK